MASINGTRSASHGFNIYTLIKTRHGTARRTHVCMYVAMYLYVALLGVVVPEEEHVVYRHPRAVDLCRADSGVNVFELLGSARKKKESSPKYLS